MLILENVLNVISLHLSFFSVIAGMQFEGSPHSGMDDSINISRIAIKMLSDGCSLNINEHIQIKYNSHDSGVVVRYEPYKDESFYDSEEEEEQRRKKADKRRRRVENEQKELLANQLDKMTLNEIEQAEEDGVEDLLTYYKLQNS